MGVPNKLPPATVAKIKRLRYQDDVSVGALAERFGVSPDSIRRACQQSVPPMIEPDGGAAMVASVTATLATVL